MTTPYEKVLALIRRALDAGASEEERRTSAMIAVKIIDEHRMLAAAPPPQIRIEYRDRVVEKVVEKVVYRDRPADPAPAPKSVEPTEPMKQRRLIAARFDSTCKRCGVAWYEGELIAWGKGLGAVCVDCHTGQTRCA